MLYCGRCNDQQVRTEPNNLDTSARHPSWVMIWSGLPGDWQNVWIKSQTDNNSNLKNIGSFSEGLAKVLGEQDISLRNLTDSIKMESWIPDYGVERKTQPFKFDFDLDGFQPKSLEAAIGFKGAVFDVFQQSISLSIFSFQGSVPVLGQVF